jgi:trehalose 6-phosphate phosphatase
VSGRFGVVAVVSGRPVAFLHERLPVPGLVLAGQYGLESWHDGEVTTDPDAAPYLGAVREVGDRAERELDDVYVERKGELAVTLHWRAAPDAEARARPWAERAAADRGLRLLPTRMAVELRPPVAVDKGVAVARLLGDGLEAALFAGDDHGDLSAFGALDAAVAAGRVRTAVRVAVRSDEAPVELLERADLAVDGPGALTDLLRDLSRRARAGS